MYKITLLKTGHINCADSVIYKNGSADTTTLIGCHAFLLEKQDRYFLIDTGIENIDIVNKTKSSVSDWERFDDEFSISKNLDRLGIDCRKIEKVFITHAHYDHISGIVHFKNADIYMTKKEYEELYSADNKLKEYLDGVKKFLKDKNVITFENELQVEDITLKLCGGHTDGSMNVFVDNYLFTGDNVFVHDNLKKGIPTGYTGDRKTTDKLFEDYLKFDGKIITSHDFLEVI